MKRHQWNDAYWWYSLILFIVIGYQTTNAQHRAGYHQVSTTTHRPQVQHLKSKYEEVTTRFPLDGPFGYIVLSMKDKFDDGSKTIGKTFGSSTARIQDDSTSFKENNNDESEEGIEKNSDVEIFNKSTIDSKYMFGGYTKREIWVIPLISIILLNLFLIMFFEIYVLCQSKGRNPLFLGQFLLLGLFLNSSSSLVFVIIPSTINCYFGTIGISISYAVIFSVLMVKSIFLISLNGGNDLPMAYQACLLMFSLLVQLVINTQSILIFPLIYQVNTSTNSFWVECGTSFNREIWPMIFYNAFLIFLVGVLALKTRRIRENYGESTFIGFTILMTIPIWVSWILGTCVLEGRQQDACIAFGCQAQSLSTFLIMFMPKGRQLAAMGDSGKLLTENQDDDYSFFHFKPGKYYKPTLIDPATGYLTSEQPTLSTLNPNVYFYRADFHPGMIY